MKSKTTAYLLLIFLGYLGAHRFYIGKVGTGLLYLFTLGLFGIGALVDLFTLSNQVDMYNLKHTGMLNQKQNQAQTQAQNIVVNLNPIESKNKTTDQNQ